MSDKNLGCTIFAISAIILAISTFNIFNKRENFTETESAQPESTAKFSSGTGFENTQRLQEYQNRVVMNTGTSTEQVNKIGAQYYLNLQNYLNPSIQNLELAQNISSQRIQAGVPLPGASSSYSNKNGNGYVDNLGYLDGSAFPPVSYSNDRAAQLSKCAKELPMFAASSLLPKPSSNASNNALSQSAARALASFTALSAVEQIGAITSNKSPYTKISDIRAIDPIPQNSVHSPMFGGASLLYGSTTFGQNNAYGKDVPNGLVGSK
jgi:hypothetical protein